MDIRVTKKIEVNLSADDWQLYDIPGREFAATQLNKAVGRALNRGDIVAAQEALSKFRAYGAADSEGYHTLERIVERM